jgi:monoamine oxidase
MEDVIIVGAGIAGLTAALDCKRAGLSYRILEACDQPGGRARSRSLASGRTVDLGAHWLHGDDNPLKAELDRYGIGYRRDEGEAIYVQEGGTLSREGGDWLEHAIDHDKAEAILKGKEADCALTELAVDAEAHQVLADFALLWDGVDPPVVPSAYEFLSDENTPGGLEIEGGMGALIQALADEAGFARIHLRTAVSKIVETGDGMRVQAMDGSEWHARRVLFTGSLGVLKSNMVAFQPPLSGDFHEHLAGLVMGRVNKIVIDCDPAFFAERDVPVDMAIELLDIDPPHFCHVHSGGQPVIQLYVAGRQAERVEGMTPAEALTYAAGVLRRVDMLRGFDLHTVSPAIVTRWVANPYTRGAYSCCLPGVKRSGPRVEGGIVFCGDTFDTRFPASVAGASRSGREGARLVIEALGVKAPESEEA